MEPKTTPPLQPIISSITEIMVAEHQALRGSLNQINSILSHAVDLLNESIIEAHKTQQNNTVELFKIISKSTRIIQAEDIISQITSRLNTRSQELDDALNEINRLCSEGASLQAVLAQLEALKTHSASPIEQHNLNAGESELF